MPQLLTTGCTALQYTRRPCGTGPHMLTVCFSTWKSSSVPCTIVTVSMPACVRQYTLTEGHGVQLLRHNWLRTASRRESLLVVLRTTVCHHSEHRCRHMLCKEPEPRTDCSYCSALSQEQPLRCEPSSSRSARANRLQPLPTSSAATTAMQCALWRCAPLERRVSHHTDATLRQPLDWRGHCVG